MSEQIFHGCKVALFIGDQLLIIQRDDKDDIPFPNLWDFPGGGREENETPTETLFREVKEELGLSLALTDVVWEKSYPGNFYPDTTVFFFVAQLAESAEHDIVFGDEGQRWTLIAVKDFLKLRNVVPSYAGRLEDWAKMTGRVL